MHIFLFTSEALACMLSFYLNPLRAAQYSALSGCSSECMAH